MASSDDVLMRGMAGFRKEVGQPLKVPVEPGQYDSSVSDRYNEIREESVRPEYRGFTVPAGMEQDESDRWFAAIDAREDERERKEAESFLTRKPEPWEGQFLEQMKALSLAASQEEQRFLRDPKARGEVYKEFAGEVYEDVMAGDPETIRNVADVSSLVDITGTSDVTSAVQSGRLAVRDPEQRAAHLTAAGISGVAGGIQLAATALGAAPLVGNLLSGARLKAAMKVDAASLSKAEEAIAAKDPVFESTLEKAAVEKLQNKTGVDAVISTLRSGGATKSEIADTKVAEFVEQAKAAGKKSITKDELIKHLDDNKVQIEEVRLSNESQKIPKDVAKRLDNLNTKATEAFNDLYDDSKAVARILAPGEDVTDQMHRFSDNSTHFNSLYVSYVGAIDRIERFENVPPDVQDVVNRVIDLNHNVSVSDWTPEDAALITNARNVINAKRADPEYKEFTRRRGNEMRSRRRRTEEEHDSIINDVAQSENLSTIARILNEMPEAETRLVALRQFQALPKYQEYIRSQKEFKDARASFEVGRKDLSPRFENYTAPAGDNYQEILLTVPQKKLTDLPESFEVLDMADVSKNENLRGQYKVFHEGSGIGGPRAVFGTPEEAKQFAIDLITETDAYELFGIRGYEKFTKSHHSDIPNVLVHIRTKDRIDDRGRKVLFVEEIQSDWHQAGRKQGYRKQEKRFKVLKKDSGDEIASFDSKDEAEAFISKNDPQREGVKLIDQSEMITPTGPFFGNPVPDAPLKDTKEWLTLAINRIFREAADGGYDGVVFSRADVITPLVTLPRDEAIDLIGSEGAFLQRLENLKQRGGDLAEGAEQAEKVFKGNQYFYDTLIPSIAQKRTKSKRSNTFIDLDPDGDPYESQKLFPFFELTDKVRDRVIKPQKLYSVALPGIAVGAAAAEEEELSAAAALGAIGLGGMALYKGAKAARVADLKVPTETSAYEGQQTVGKVVFDSKDGMGAVPNSKNVAYKGFVVWMKPQDFLGLNPVRSSESAADTVKAVTEAIEEGKPIGPPFLNVKLVKDGDDAGSFQVVQHEGRGRMAAINSIQPDVPVPVHVFGSGAIDRGRDITPEMMQGLVDPTSNVKLLPDKKATDGKAVTPDAAWHVPDSDDYDPNYLPVGKTYRADAAMPPAATDVATVKPIQMTFAAPAKLPETPDEIEAAFSEMNRIQRGAPESAMERFRVHNIGEGPAGYLAEHIGDLTARLGHRAYGPVAEKVGKTHGSLLMGFETPPLQDVLTDKSYRKKLLDKGYERYSMMMEGGYPSMTRDEWVKKFDEKLAKYADEHRKVPVYNEVQRLANDAAVALGEQRYTDVRDSLAKLQKYIDEGEERFTARMSWVEPEFARFPGGETPPGKAVKTELPDFSAEYKQKKELDDLVRDLMAGRKAAEQADASKEAVKSTKAKPPAATDVATAGAKTEDEAVEAARLWREMGTESPYFKRKFGNSKVVDEDGEVLPVFHGTSGDFNEFRIGSSEGAFGSAIYFSDNVDDVNLNYARAEGPDIKNRVEREFDRIQDLDDFDDDDILDAAQRYMDRTESTDTELLEAIKTGNVEKLKDEFEPDLIEQIARQIVLGDENFSVMKTYVNIENPVYLDPSGTKGRTTFNLEFEYDEAGDIVDESGSVIDLLEAIDDVAYDFDNRTKLQGSPGLFNAQKLKSFIVENSDDGEIDALDIYKEIKGGEYYFQSDTGGLENTEFIRQVFENMGFDGIIADAHHFFGPRQGFAGGRIPGMADVTPGTYHYMAFNPEQIKSATGNVGTFDPSGNILKGIGVGAAVPAAAAVRSQRQEEQGNPLSEPPEYEPVSYEGGYSQAIDFSETAALVEKMIGLSNEAQDLYTQMGLIEAEYASLNEEDKIGKRGKLLAEWYDDSADKFSEAGRQLDESEYDRYLMGSDTYYDTDPKGIQGYDDVRLFVNTGYSGDPMLLDADLRASQENKQRKRLKETIGNGGPMLDMFGKSGDLNRYLYQKAKFFEHPVQTVQLNNDQKRILAKDYYNLEALKETGLISYLLYKELLGNVELV